MQSLGDRMKMYENAARYSLTRRMPLIVRVDGKAFHTYTRKAKRPFDNVLINSMIKAGMHVAKQMQGFKLGYVQSDEISFFLTDYDNFETEAWFGKNLQKTASVAASLTTMHFNNAVRNTDYLPPCACFDARAFVLPESEIANYFLWRARDWQRNALRMFARSHFSESKLHKKSSSDVKEMLCDIGASWSDADLSDAERNGTFFWADSRYEIGMINGSHVHADYEEINTLVSDIINAFNSKETKKDAY